MSETQLLGLVSTLFALLSMVLAWAGGRVFNKLDKLSDQMAEIHMGLQRQMKAGDDVLHTRVNELDRRVTRVEARCQVKHDEGKE